MVKFRRREIIAEGGGLWFVGALTPHDPVSGRLIGGAGLPEEIRRARAGLMFFDVPEQAVMAQTWALYQQLAQLLRQQSLSLRQLVRQRLLIGDARDLPAVERVMDLALGGWMPATTVVVMPPGKAHPQLRVQLDAIAAADRTAIAVIQGAPGSRYPAAVTAGSFIFTSGVDGLAGTDGSSRANESDLRVIRTPRQRAIYQESLQTFANLEKVLGKANARIRDLLKVNGWVDFPMREYGATVLARQRFFDRTKENMMASTGLAVGGTGNPEAHVAFDAIALASGKDIAGKEVSGLASPIASPYVAGAVKGGGLVFTSGEIPVVMPDGEVMSACELLPDEGRLLRLGHAEPESGMESRAWYVYRTLEGYLQKFGNSFDRVVHQTVFMEHPEEFPVLERIATLFYGATLPPTTLVPIADTTPFRSAELEIEVVARA